MTNFGDSMYAIACALLVYQLTESTFYSGLSLFLTSSTAIVQLLLSPLLDRVNMKRFLVASQWLQAVLILAFPLLIFLGQLTVYHLLILMPLISLINQCVYPGQLSLLPKIVAELDLVKANALFSVAYQGSNAIFDTLAGLMITSLGFMTTFLMDSVIFVLVGLLFTCLSQAIYQVPQDQRPEAVSHNYLYLLQQGLALFKDMRLFSLLVGVVFINFAATGISAILPAFTQGGLYYSWLLGAMGAGVIVGSLLSGLNMFKRCPLGLIYIVGLSLTGLSWLAVAYAQGNIWLTVGLYALGWTVVGLVNVYAQTMLQKLVAQDKLASATGAMVGLSTFMAPIGALLAGWLGEYLPSFRVMSLASMMILAVSFYWFLTQSIRQLPSVDCM